MNYIKHTYAEMKKTNKKNSLNPLQVGQSGSKQIS